MRPGLALKFNLTSSASSRFSIFMVNLERAKSEQKAGIFARSRLTIKIEKLRNRKTRA
jgi:hypothetical protein